MEAEKQLALKKLEAEMESLKAQASKAQQAEKEKMEKRNRELMLELQRQKDVVCRFCLRIWISFRLVCIECFF